MDDDLFVFDWFDWFDKCRMYVTSNIDEIWLKLKLMMICLFLIDLINVGSMYHQILMKFDWDWNWWFDWFNWFDKFDKCSQYVTSKIDEIWLNLKLMMICLFLIDLIDLINVESM
jgi:hypothetical protein